MATITLSITQTATSVVNFSRIVGSWNSYFSLNHLVAPAFGSVLTWSEIAGVSTIRTLIHLLRYPVVGLFGMTYYLPSLGATAYMRAFESGRATVMQRAFFALVPLACMAVFMLHPVGSLAAPYALYWLIPVGTALWARQSLFAHALGATFTAHALGSVLFLLATPMTPVFWLALIPQVAAERLVYALGIAATVKLIRIYKKSPIFGPAITLS